MENFGSNEEDRISALPDELIHRILSRGVDLNVVVQTSVLSKRWVNIWSTFQFLNFNAHPLSHGYDGMYPNKAIYCNFITKFLLGRNQHSGACFVEIDFEPFNPCVKGMILSILSHAVSHSVQELYIYRANIDSYLSFPALRTLSLDHCEVKLTKWSLPCLTTLHLVTVFPYGEDFSFKELLYLKNLSIGDSTGAFFATHLEVVRIDSPNLETFQIYQGNTLPPNCMFVVSAPKLRYFSFDGGFFGYVPVLSAEGGFPCLEVVALNIDATYTFEDNIPVDDNQVNEIMPKISSLFREFGETQVLILFQGTIQVLSRVQDFSIYQPSPFVNLNSLHLINYVPPGPIYDPDCCADPVIKYLLSNSPDAEIIMKISEADYNAFDSDSNTSD